jgi:hypothetical protein
LASRRKWKAAVRECVKSATIGPRRAELNCPEADLNTLGSGELDPYAVPERCRGHADWNRRGGLGYTGDGAVYAFVGQNGKALYVGQTGASLKERANYETSCQGVAYFSC